MPRFSTALSLLFVIGATALFVARHFTLSYIDAWFAGANACAFTIFLVDKALAAERRKESRRVPETALVSAAVCGGAAGAVAAMVVGRHKTKKWGTAPFILLTIVQATAFWILR